MANITAGGQVLGDNWIAVAQNTLVESTILDVSSDLGDILLLQAALDTTTAHTGTKITVQISWKTSGDEDWVDYAGGSFIILIGTAATDLIEDNPLTASSTSLTLTGHALTEEGIWLFIEDGTLINSEIGLVASQSANAVVLLDGTTREHALNTAVFNIAISKTIAHLTKEVRRVRVIIDNTYDNDGSTLNYRLMITRATDIA